MAMSIVGNVQYQNHDRAAPIPVQLGRATYPEARDEAINDDAGPMTHEDLGVRYRFRGGDFSFDLVNQTQTAMNYLDVPVSDPSPQDSEGESSDQM